MYDIFCMVHCKTLLCYVCIFRCIHSHKKPKIHVSLFTARYTIMLFFLLSISNSSSLHICYHIFYVVVLMYFFNLFPVFFEETKCFAQFWARKSFIQLNECCLLKKIRMKVFASIYHQKVLVILCLYIHIYILIRLY